MPDLTHIFRTTVQDLSQATGSKAPVQAPKANKDPWIKESHQISRTMADLRAFILTTRPAYLNLSRGVGGANKPMQLPRRSNTDDGIGNGNNRFSNATTASSKVLQSLLDTISSLTTLSDRDRDSIDTQVKVMMMQMKGAIEELESLEQVRRKRPQQHENRSGSATGLNQFWTAIGASAGVDYITQHRQGILLYLNERLAGLATLHKDLYEARVAREMEKRESSLYKALPKSGPMDSSGGLTQRRPPTSSGAGVSRNGLIDRSHSPQLAHHGTVPGPGGPGAGAWGDHHHSGSSASGISSAHHYHQGISQSASSTVRAGTTPVDSNPSAGMLDYENDFEQGLSAEQRQMLELENENIVQRLETELNQVRHIETSMLELSSLHSTIQEHLEVQTQQTNRLHDEALAAIDLISSGNDQLIKAGQRNQSTRKWILFFLILASFVLLFLDWYD